MRKGCLDGGLSVFHNKQMDLAMNVLRKALAVASLSLLMASAHADIISLDWNEAGDNKAFLDSDAGLEWLKLDAAKGMSINEVSGELGDGGLFNGWRIANKTEVSNLLFQQVIRLTDAESNGFFLNTNGRYYADQSLQRTNEARLNHNSVKFGWMNLFGATYSTSSTTRVDEQDTLTGLYENDSIDPAIQGDILRSITRTRKYNNFYTYYSARIDHDYNDANITRDSKSANASVFLISDGGATLSSQLDPTLMENNPNYATAVSEPGAMLLLGAGLFGLMMARRKA